MAPTPVTPWRVRKPPPQLAGRGNEGVGVLIAAVWQGDAERQMSIRSEAGIDLLDFDERARQQAGADEQHDAQGDLHDDQRRAHPIRAKANPLARVRQRAMARQAAWQELGRRREREQQAPDHRDGEREPEDGDVDPRRLNAAEGVGRERERAPAIPRSPRSDRRPRRRASAGGLRPATGAAAARGWRRARAAARSPASATPRAR